MRDWRRDLACQNLPNVWQLKWQHQSNAPHLATDQIQEALISILEYILETRGGFYCADLTAKCCKNVLWTKYLLSWSHCNSLTHFQSHSSTHRLLGMAMNSTRENWFTWEQASWYLATAQSRWVPDKESSVPTIFAATT
jgi:hypothetical protein